jgi:hypothetical protein
MAVPSKVVRAAFTAVVVASMAARVAAGVVRQDRSVYEVADEITTGSLSAASFATARAYWSSGDCITSLARGATQRKTEYGYGSEDYSVAPY